MDPQNPGGGTPPPGGQPPYQSYGGPPQYPSGGYQPPQQYAPPPPKESMGTGAKVGIGIAIGCVTCVIIILVVMLAMGACTCSACSSCCSEMSDLAEKSREAEAREAAKLRSMGETVHVDSLAVMVTDAQRQETTVVATLEIENTSMLDESLDPTQFILEDSENSRYAVDRDKAEITESGVQAGQILEGETTLTVRAVFTVPAEATGLILEFKTAEPSSHSRRFSLGL